MFIIFAFVALSAAVEYNKAKYLVQTEGHERKVLILNTCSPTSDQNSRSKYEAISATEYKKHVYPGTDTKCTGTPTSTSLQLSPSDGTKYEYAETLPNNVAYRVESLAEQCAVVVENELTIYLADCVKEKVSEGVLSVKVIKQTDNMLTKNYFSDDNCQTAVTDSPKDEIAACGSCGTIAATTSSLKCEKYSPSSTPSGGSTTPVDYNTAKFAISKSQRVDKSVVELRKCSKAEGNKYIKSVGTSATQYKTCAYTDDKCTAGENCEREEDGEFVNELPKHIGYSVLSADSQCATLTDASFTIYVEGCIETNVVQGGKYEKAVIEGGKFKIKSYSDDKCTTPNSENLLKERDVQECGKCNGEGQRSAMKCHTYGSNGSIQTFVLFALTILLFLF